MKATIKKINSILSSKERRFVGVLIFLMFIGGLLELVGVSGIFPLIQGILDMDSDNVNFVMLLALGLIAIYIFKNIFLILMYRTLFRFTSKGKGELSTRLMNIYMKEPYEFHLKRNVALIQRAVRSDTEGFYNVVRDLLQILCEVIISCILGILLIITNVWMALFLIVLVGSCMLAIFVISKRKISALGKEEMECSTSLNKWLLQGIGGIKEIRILGTEDYFTDRFKSEAKLASNISASQQLYMQLPRLLTETVCIGGVLIYIVIACKAGMNLTELLPTLAVFAVAAFRLLPSVGKINGLLNDYHFYKPRVDYIYEDIQGIEAATEISEEHTELPFEKDICIKNLTFSYDPKLDDVLKDINLDIKKCEAVAFVGPSGAGKTTLADVIMGLLNPKSGDITVDGKSIYEDLRGWYSLIGYVPQTIYLSDDSIINNIAFGIPEEDINMDKINEVVKKAKLQEFVDSLPDGLNTVVGDRGVRLSGGQRQRIGIARALYSEPQLLVLDEATSALDNDTEQAIIQAIEELQGTITMIVIAHRLSTIKNCDRIYEVKDAVVTCQ